MSRTIWFVKWTVVVAGVLLVVAAAGIAFLINEFDRELPTGAEIRDLYDDRAGSSDDFIRLTDLPVHVPNAVLAAERSKYLSEGGKFGSCFAEIAMILIGKMPPVCDRPILHWMGRSTLHELRPELTGPQRHVERLLVSWKVDSALSREEVMELLINTSNFGRDAEGINKAAFVYFGKAAAELRSSESAFLAGLLRAPNMYDTRQYPERAKKRRDFVLETMFERGMISGAELRLAMSEALPQ